MFLNELTVSPMVGTRSTFRVKEDLYYRTSNGMDIVVPKGFVYDGASIPIVLTSLLPKIGFKYDRASCLHDWLYSATNTHNYSRKECDDLFYESMRKDKVSWVLAKVMYYAVRLFGSKHYGSTLIIKN